MPSDPLQPGPELDQLVAQKVMASTTIMGHPVLVDPSLPPGEFRFESVPPYSTDMAAAWQVARWLKERWGGFFSLDGYPRSGWICANNDAYSRTHSPTIEARADTPQMAICLAALKTAELLPHE